MRQSRARKGHSGHRRTGGPRRAMNEDYLPLNNNRNNRRRGRGNRNQGGANSANRIDSRARGNAPQLLDKYKKLAQDAQHNGDRVQAEYYLQFADHYFRVIADNKARQDEAKAKRQDDREQNQSDDDDSDDTDDRRSNRRLRGRRDDQDEGGRKDKGDRGDKAAKRSRKKDGDEGEFEPDENPFTRRDDDAPKKRRAPRKAKATEEGNAGAEGEIDAAVLPPSISASEDAAEKPAPRRRRKKDADEEANAA